MRAHKHLTLSADGLRRVPVGARGTWVPSKRHVKLDNVKGLPQELISHCPEQKYPLMLAFEALFCLESSHLIIYHNALPVSLAEAYQLILSDDGQRFRNYRVFQQLNRTGYICHKPCQPFLASGITPRVGHQAEVQRSTDESGSTTRKTITNLRPLFELDPAGSPSDEVYACLRLHGPKEWPPCNKVDGLDTGVRLKVNFDVYKRETYFRDRPRKGAPGTPKFRLVVCDVQDQCSQTEQAWRRMLMAGGATQRDLN